MNRNRKTDRFPLFVRIARSTWIRSVAVYCLVPVLLLGAFGGTNYLIHSHGEFDFHLHVPPSEAASRVSAEEHRVWHTIEATECATSNSVSGGVNLCKAHVDSSSYRCGDAVIPTSTDTPDWLIITIPDFEQMRVRAGDLSPTLKAAQFTRSLLAPGWPEPSVCPRLRPPAEYSPGLPAQLAALTAGQRIVRTSQALLI